ncbi:hypothetical protein [Deminuibacter soli]|uniref:Lipocalin-like domain-containing protein n=1 Tax=Deminuibacter soli TaxID=2291815 RepID=A0A3E1NJB6_9BACT|nr:hypothetical protein [Deminuibacter soli]RFM28012.1 hypothetical protein DXN05_10750 [Deminuibacter soli]
MKKNKLPLLALAATALAAATITGCFKSNDSQPASLTKNQVFMVQKPWAIRSITIPKKNDSTQDSSIFQPCHSKAGIYFGQPVYSDGSGAFAYLDSAKGCDSNAFHYGQGRWLFATAAEDSLATLNYSYGISVMKVLALNDSVLQVRFIDSMRNAPKILKTITFVH